MKVGLSKEQILEIANRKGMFSVSLRWRDDRLRAKCFALRKEGKLTGARRIERGYYHFYPMKEKADELVQQSKSDRGTARS